MDSGIKVKVSYPFPASLGGGKVVMRELGVEEQLTLSKVFGEEPARRVDEAIKRAVVSVRGEAWTPENRDAKWSELGAKERDLVALGYSDMHMNRADDRDSFLAGRSVEVDGG